METIQPIGESRRIKVPLLRIVKGNNPRSEEEFVEADLVKFAANIDAVDIIQDPVVTEGPDGTYPLLAGERRVRAARLSKRYGEDGEIWVLVREADPLLNEAVSLSENIEREPMTPLDEAEAAGKMLAQCGSDREEAARVLGWSPDVLNKRLGLMNAAPEVRQALRGRKIKLGHAELLSSMRKESQVAALTLLLGRELLLPVAEFKSLIEKQALVLDQAIFAKGDCAGCQHNSSNQSVLFAEAISGGKCTNKQCFDAKSEQELQARAEALKDDYQVVRIARPGENFTIVPLVSAGVKGVGDEQAKACRSCKSFGAVISGVPDKLGNVYKDMCLDVTCNVKKVAEFHKPKEEPKQEPAAGEKPNGKADAKRGSSGKAKGSDKPAAKTGSSEPTSRVKEYREKLWRKIFKVAVGKLDVPSNRMVLVALCLTRPSVIDSDQLKRDCESVIPVETLAKPAAVLKDLLSLEQKQLAQVVHQIAANVNGGFNGGLGIEDVTGILSAFDVKVSDYWKVSKSFLELLTKNEIDVVCDEIGVKAAMGAEYAKARNLKVAEFIDAVMAAKDFDFAGKVPKIMTW
jgi:ParB family transcriptional regulator, chromosome partitioning protein